MIHDQQRIEAIRSRASVRLKSITKMESTIEHPSFRECLQPPRDLLGDIEPFLAALSWSDRTREEERLWLDQAEDALRVAEEQCAFIEQWFENYQSGTQAA
jgi:hypothetical protein